jgi:hypothetical protein
MILMQRLVKVDGKVSACWTTQLVDSVQGGCTAVGCVAASVHLLVACVSPVPGQADCHTLPSC